jgi:hypothetical protein
VGDGGAQFYGERGQLDSDGVGDNADTFPTNSTGSVDSDGDGVGDAADAFPTILRERGQRWRWSG